MKLSIILIFSGKKNIRVLFVRCFFFLHSWRSRLKEIKAKSAIICHKSFTIQLFSEKLRKTQFCKSYCFECGILVKCKNSSLFCSTQESWGEGCMHTLISWLIYNHKPEYNCSINYYLPLSERILNWFFLKKKSILMFNYLSIDHCFLKSNFH